jgi:hypothetical protein
MTAAAHDRSRPWGRHLAIALTALAGAGALASGCAETGFECGREVPGKPGTFRRCDRENEVCVCHTNSCAKRVSQGTFSDNASLEGEAAQPTCPSGWQYVEAPFARSDVAGKCVPQSHVQLSGDAGLKDFSEGQLICPGSPISPPASPSPPTPEPPRDGGSDEQDSGATPNEPLQDAGSSSGDAAPETPVDAGSDGSAP